MKGFSQETMKLFIEKLVTSAPKTQQLHGCVLFYKKLGDCPETGDQRIQLIVEISPRFVKEDVKISREFIVYVGGMQKPSYEFTQNSWQGHKGLYAMWRAPESGGVPEKIYLYGSPEIYSLFSETIWPK